MPSSSDRAGNQHSDRAELEGRWFRSFEAGLLAKLPTESARQTRGDGEAALARGAFTFFATRAEEVQVRAEQHDGLIAVESAMRDCAFIIDTTLEYFREIGATVRTIVHPVFKVSRDSQGHLVSFEKGVAAERPESFVHAELELPSYDGAADRIAAELAERLGEVRVVTSDFDAMAARALGICDETAALRELVEVRELLRWLVGGGLVFLGYRGYRASGAKPGDVIELEPDSGLGILREPARSRFARSRPLDELTPSQRRLMFDGPALMIGKTRAESRVHRRRSMDDITIRREPENGAIVFERFLGLFTSKAYAEEAQYIPVLRAKLRDVLAAESAQPGSHDYKDVVATFNSLPKEELFRAPVEELREQVRLIRDFKSESETLLSLYSDANRSNVIALVVVPRDRFSAGMRTAIQDVLVRGLRAPLIYYHLAFPEGYTARLHFCFAAAPPAPELISQLEGEVARLARTWEERLGDELAARFGEVRGRELRARWSHAFSPEYQDSTPTRIALRDIERIEALLAGGAADVELTPENRDGADGTSELRMYELGAAPILTELMPLLQNFGMRVLSEDAHELTVLINGKLRPVHVQVFRIQGANGSRLSELPGAPLVADALSAAMRRQIEDDALNALVLAAGLNWREIALLDAYVAAAFQMELAPARMASRRVLLQNPALARIFIDLFVARLDPDREIDPAQIEQLKGFYRERLGAIDNIADDRIARRLLAMVEATTRTNYFCPRPSPDAYIGLKFESARIPDLRDTPPLYEIHVHSPALEGCHLRAGKVARGGIRFSDRPDDYRSEILGLMKTQTVKNAIIVPVGAKGGFIVKARAGRDLTRDDVVAAYRSLISALLDLTDNLFDRRVVHPPRVKVLDDDGAYLVVAADKGTAAFSDIANQIAIERGFWLGDAFASGGEHGYDHKRLGITARGAWESARRHLREMGRDPDGGAPITMVGIGDMSGDVFGNGLLRSSNVKLIAAFDHRHIFLDPDPDPKESFEERRRLYAMPGSQWSDYDRTLISPGGGVFRRGQKRIELSPQAREALSCAADAPDSDALICAILRAPADALYNGGIGTYVRASDETDLQAGDHANDACRIAASELRVRIVIEGGNLGFTQKARIEYALQGGRINTDAIDNSAGVDMSDHEVNLKILLQPALGRGNLTDGQRNDALAGAAEEVAELVLRHNRDQALLLSLDQIRSRTQAGIFSEHLGEIEQRGLAHLTEGGLPTREALAERGAQFAGLTRPELAALSAYTKIDLTRRVEGCAMIDDDYLVQRFLHSYFPPSIARRFADEIPHHQLRRELIAGGIANQLVDSLGTTFVFGLGRRLGATADEIVRAWVIASGLLGLPGRFGELHERAAELTIEAESAAFFALERASRRTTRWALINCDCAAAIGPTVDRFQVWSRVAGDLSASLRAGEQDRFERSYRELRTCGHTEEAALELARLMFADHLLTVVKLAFATGAEDLTAVAAAYFGMSDDIEFALLEGALERIGIEDRWENSAAQNLALELDDARIELCRAIVEQRIGTYDRDALERITRKPQLAQVARLMAELKALPALGLAPLEVAVHAIAQLAKP